MAKLLEGKVAIVAGGSGGLGAAICRSLAVDGAKVLVVGRDEARVGATAVKVREAGSFAEGCVVDLTGVNGPTRVVEDALKHFGRIDILVNSAGVFIWKKFLDQSRDDWENTLSANLSVPFYLTQEVSRVMIDQGSGGSILNIASIHGSVGDANVVGHCAAKFGLVGLTRASAEALREFNIRVNAISPGMIASHSADRRGESPMESVTQGDLATLAVFYVSDLARTITGTVVDAHGSTRGVIKA